MWQLAFSSKSVFRKTRPERPTRESPSTSATSPEHAGVLVLAQLLTDQLGAGARVHLDCAAALEADLEVTDDVARQRQRLRRADDALGAAAIRAREDLLGGHVDDVPAAVDRLLERGAPGRAGDQPDGEIGARAPEAEAVERALVQQARRARRACRCACARPRRGRARRGASRRRPPPRAARRRARRRRRSPSPRSDRRGSSS